MSRCFQCDLDIAHVCYAGIRNARWGMGDEAVAALEGAQRHGYMLPSLSLTKKTRADGEARRTSRGDQGVVNLRARWIGPSPRAGDFLMSEIRPRYAYRIERCTPALNVDWDAAAKAEVRTLKIVVERVAASAVPKHARIHPWRWDKRGARSKGGS